MQRVLGLVLGVVLLVSGLGWAEDKFIRLEYKPKSEVNVKLRRIPPTRIFWEDLRDTRPRPWEIGENQEDRKKSVRILTESDREVKIFVQTVLKEELRDKGFRFESNPQAAEKRISASILKFWTVEGKTYESETELQLEIKDKTGETFFKKIYGGTGTNRGRSLSEVNYQESISESLNRLLEKILADPEFLSALAESGPEAPRATPDPLTDKEKGSLEKVKTDRKKPTPEEEEKEAKRLEEKRLEEIREAERKLEEKRREEQRAAEKRLEEIRAEEKRLEELRMEIKRLEEKKAEERRMEELRAEEKRLEELREEIRRLEEKRAQEKAALPAGTEAQIEEEEKTPTKSKAKKPAPAKTPAKSKDPYFGPK